MTRLRKLLRVGILVGVGMVECSSLTGCAKEPYELELVGYDYTDRALLDVAVNGISDPVRTPFGYHAIKVTDVQEGGVTPLKDVAAGIRAQLG